MTQRSTNVSSRRSFEQALQPSRGVYSITRIMTCWGLYWKGQQFVAECKPVNVLPHHGHDVVLFTALLLAEMLEKATFSCQAI